MSIIKQKSKTLNHNNRISIIWQYIIIILAGILLYTLLAYTHYKIIQKIDNLSNKEIKTHYIK